MVYAVWRALSVKKSSDVPESFGDDSRVVQSIANRRRWILGRMMVVVVSFTPSSIQLADSPLSTRST